MKINAQFLKDSKPTSSLAVLVWLLVNSERREHVVLRPYATECPLANSPVVAG